MDFTNLWLRIHKVDDTNAKLWPNPVNIMLRISLGSTDHSALLQLGYHILLLTTLCQHRLRMSENRVVRRIVGPKSDKVMGGCR
jgi:hypothetical protein